jgi:assimilatory nitrate reductase catalytic subunit
LNPRERIPVRVCRLEDIVPDSGVCALVAGEQVAVFRVEGKIHAVGNRDPFSGANVLSRGIVGDLKGELVVASPVYKQHFSLLTGRCVEDGAVRVPVYGARVEEGFVVVEPRHEVATACCYCGVGCGVIASVSNNEVTAVRGDPSHPANLGQLCTKGLSLHKADPSYRALVPEIGDRRATWDEALDFAAGKFRQVIEQHGPDAVAFYISGQLLTEDYYVFNKLAKGLIGTNNVDTNSRLCMASAVAGYKQTLGADAPPACYEDLESAECVFIAGSNAAWAHPVLFRRMEAAKPKHVVVVDPRRTETARAATLHLQIAPGTDVALFSGMLHVMRRQGWCDATYIRAHTEGFDALQDLPLEEAAALCGVPANDIFEAARVFATSKSTLSLYCQGLNQSASGTAKNVALINLHLATGQIGKPGAGPFSLTGQPNAMGGREVGGMANLLSAHRDLNSEKDRNEVAALWGVRSVPERPGKTAVEMFEAVREGKIKAIWIACTNPAQSLPDQNLVHEALERAELVVVQDAYRNTETAAYADVFLPAAGWGEKEGTMTNSERRISRVRAAVKPPGEARPDWKIAVDFARRLLPQGEALFPYQTPESIFNEHRETTRGRDLDITGLSYRLLDERGPQQWPFPEKAGTGRKRLYEDGVFPTKSGRAHFVATPYQPVAEATDARYPLRLTTGRLRDQWHTMSRTGTVASLFAHEPEPRVMAHPEDLAGLGIKDSELIRIASRRGHVYARAAADLDLARGVVFAPMHWGARFLGGAGRRGINELTLGALDPSSRQPELKHCAVSLEKAQLPWRLVAFGYADFEALGKFMQATPCAVRTLIGRERPGVRLALAAEEPPPAKLLGEIDALFGLDAEDVVHIDIAKGMGRRVALDADVVRAVRLSGDTAAEPWLRELWERAVPVGELGRYLSLPVDAPPGTPPPRGRTVCNCFDVAEGDIRIFLGESKSLADLQASLKCGTSCGSCLPELRRMATAQASR